jgi:hypothetical protein
MTPDGDEILQEVSLPVALTRQALPAVASGSDEYITAVRQKSYAKLTNLNAQVRVAQRRETILWWFFVLAFILTLVAGGAGVALILLGSLKVAIASGAAGVIPGCTSAWLKREGTTLSRNRQAIEAKRDEELRLRQAVAAIADLPSSPEKDKLQVDYARKLLSRIPK